ncbi:Na(+)/H(+) antiporter subunit C [Streptomyces prasinopilosus]|uniref:Multicomponent Na+:H+ antiporter subunit C n=1 Tax=Streptomyces prasinopilosus TaxID=67344 RepID=A0A1G6V283_9ACTN|nr:Na(+)/H(+) antiporter subunit C [Streptomyces prasinopilosus]SDD47749.1 multicomponent Na+:H+ antiporter subunit C [Streptomyces prasinopilosus]
MTGAVDNTVNTLDVTMAVVVGGLFTIGFHLMLQRSLMRIVLGFILLGHGTNMLLLVAGGTPGLPPVLEGRPVDPAEPADPLPQAMALTSIIITFGLTAFLMALAYRSWRLSGSDEVRDDVEDRRIDIALQRAGADEVSGPSGAPGGPGPDDGGGPGDEDDDEGGGAPDRRDDDGTAPGDHR